MTKDKKIKEKNLDKNKKNVKEKKDDKHVIEVDTKETVEQKDDELTARINQLYGVSSGPLKEERQYDPKELEEVRKKLILLLIGIIIVGVVVLVLLNNPFDFGGNNTQTNEEKPDDTEIIDENVIPIGEIDLSNETVLMLNNMVAFYYSEFLSIDLFPLYTNDITDINTLSNDIKLYLFQRNTLFDDMLSEVGIDSYIDTCDSNGLTLSKDTFDKTLAKFYGPNVTVEYQNINYTHYNDDVDGVKLTLTYADGNYIIKCNDFATNSNLTKYVQQDLIKAVKTETSIELYQNVVFINQTGVYKDPAFTQLITNDPSAQLTDYISEGPVYKYTFTEDGENYYLTKIEKTSETSN